MNTRPVVKYAVAVIIGVIVGAGIVAFVALSLGCSEGKQPLPAESRAWIDAKGVQHNISHVYNPRTHRVEKVGQ